MENNNFIPNGTLVKCKMNGVIRFVTRQTSERLFEDDGVVSGIAPCKNCHYSNYEAIGKLIMENKVSDDQLRDLVMEIVEAMKSIVLLDKGKVDKIISDYKIKNQKALKTVDGYAVIDDWVFGVNKKTHVILCFGIIYGKVVSPFWADEKEYLFFKERSNAIKFVEGMKTIQNERLNSMLQQGAWENEKKRNDHHKDFLGKLLCFDFKKKKEEQKSKYSRGIISFWCHHLNSVFEKIGSAESYDEWCERNIVIENHKIHSVKNSSGEVLTVGDETNFGKIEKFEILTSVRQGFVGVESPKTFKLVADLEEGEHKWRPIDTIHPVKKSEAKKFISEDGFELKDGQKEYGVDENFKIHELIFDQGEFEARGVPAGWKYFRYASNAILHVQCQMQVNNNEIEDHWQKLSIEKSRIKEVIDSTFEWATAKGGIPLKYFCDNIKEKLFIK